MPQDKDTTMVFGEKNFLVSLQKAVSIILDNPSSLKFSDKHFGFPAAWALRFGSRLKLTLLLFPFFQVSDPAAYPTSGIGKMLACGKDVFYRFLSDSRIDWRKFGYLLARQLISKTEKCDDEPSLKPQCLIIDDTDLPKTEKCFESIERAFPHIMREHIVGYKALFVGCHDGKSFFALDFSLYGEKGKNKEKPYEFSRKETKRRFAEKRDGEAPVHARIKEYFGSKIDGGMAMVNNAISQGIRFEYVLCDSWFTC